MNRRDALGLMAASLALANGACTAPPNERILPYLQLPEAHVAGMPLYYASAHVRDGHAHGVLIGTREGRPIKIEGNTSHPSSLGATDVFDQAAVLQLWDPDRSTTVVQRLGAPRAGQRERPALAVSTWAAFETQWRRLAPRLATEGGARLRVLTGPLTSPSERAMLARLLQRYPRARWHVHAPLHDRAAREGSRLAFGRSLQPLLHLDRADCVLSVGADPFSEGPGNVRHAMDWSRRRAAGRDSGALPRLLAVESRAGLFGARADTRLGLTPADAEALLWRVASHWLDGADAAHPAAAGVAAFEQQAVQALRQAGPAALVLAGPALSPQAHALTFALNQRLAATGTTLELIEPPDAADGAGTLAELVQALNGGEVDTLVLLDVNPAYDAPGSLGWAEAQARARLSVHAGLHADETAALSDWHLPLSHDIERWGDALAHDGSATLVQPAILPLYDSRSALELLALMAGDDERSGHALLQRQWRAHAATDFDGFWRDALRRGVVEGTAFAPVRPGPARFEPRPPAPHGAALLALFVPDACVHDGRHANNGWLQELPRPFTKLTWDNAIELSPRDAAALGVATGDIVQAEVDGRRVEAPVWVAERQPAGVATLPLGYGRRRAGQVGTGVGFDAYALRPGGAYTAALRLAPTGRRHDFAVTQHEIGQAGRELARTVPPGGRIEEPGLQHPSLYPEYRYPERAWAMVIDLDACVGCNACTVACQAENNIPVVGKEQVAAGREMHWIRVDRYDLPQSGHTVFQPVPCMQCEKAPCELVCPVGATMHDSEGVNVQVYNRCVGTRFCSNNCPYKVRRFNFLQYSDKADETLALMHNPDVTVRRRGVMEKCNYCLQRLSRARHHVEETGRPLADGDVMTACQAACPTRAIRFGDLNDRQSDVAQQKRSPRHYALLGELNTQPRTTYLARVTRADDDAT